MTQLAPANASNRAGTGLPARSSNCRGTARTLRFLQVPYPIYGNDPSNRAGTEGSLKIVELPRNSKNVSRFLQVPYPIYGNDPYWSGAAAR